MILHYFCNRHGQFLARSKAFARREACLPLVAFRIQSPIKSFLSPARRLGWSRKKGKFLWRLRLDSIVDRPLIVSTRSWLTLEWVLTVCRAGRRSMADAATTGLRGSPMMYSVPLKT